MTTTLETPDILDLAREGIYRFLAIALSDPREERFALVLDPNQHAWLRDALDLIREEALSQHVPCGFGELPPQYLRLEEILAEIAKGRGQLVEEYDRVHGLTMARECPPYETEYFENAEPFFRSQQMADIAGFYRAFGLREAQSPAERPDSLALELEFMAFLLMKQRLAGEGTEQANICAEAARTFFRDHLAWWVPSFATGLQRKAGTGFAAAVGQLLAAFMLVERVRFEVSAPRLPLQPAAPEEPEECTACAGCSK